MKAFNIFTFMFALFTLQVHAGLLKVTDFPELKNEKPFKYYEKYAMGKDRTAYFSEWNRVIVNSTEYGKVLTLYVGRSQNHSKEEHQFFSDMSGKFSRNKIVLKYKMLDFPFEGENEVKTRSKKKQVVADCELTYKFSSTKITYELEVTALLPYGCLPASQIRIYGLKKTDEEKDTKVFKKNRKKTLTKLTPMKKGKPITLEIFDSSDIIVEKAKKAKIKNYWGFQTIEYTKRLGCKSIKISSKDKKYSYFNLHRSSGFTAYKHNAITHKITDIKSLTERFKCKSWKGGVTSTSRLIKGKKYKLIGEISIK